MAKNVLYETVFNGQSEYMIVSNSSLNNKSLIFMLISNKYCIPLPHEYEKDYIPISHFTHADSL